MTVRISAAGVLAAALTACTAGSSSDGANPAPSAKPVVASSAAPSTGTSAGSSAGSGAAAGATFGDIPGIVAKVQPSVVTVFVTTAKGSGLGSGVVWKSDGSIITNDHVAGDATSIQVAFADGKRVAATLVATDPNTDIAVIKADRAGLPVAEFDTNIPPVGTLAIAMGSPLGFEESVTAGIISGTNREIPGGGAALVGLIQTDAPISPGNSGGALVGPNAKVVGINDAYLPPQQTGAVSIGFAIPAATALDAAEQLVATGRVERPYLGVSLQPLTPQIAQQLGVQTQSGVVVIDVPDGGPASAAGVQPGDVITALAGKEIADVQDIFAGLRRQKVGDEVAVTILRDGASSEITLTLGASPGR